MGKLVYRSFINISLRGLTLLSKFIFIFLLGKYAEDEFFLGEYGIIVTSISLIIYLVGFDYYVFNTREILKSKENIIEKIRNQFFFHLLPYGLVSIIHHQYQISHAELSQEQRPRSSCSGMSSLYLVII